MSTSQSTDTVSASEKKARRTAAWAAATRSLRNRHKDEFALLLAAECNAAGIPAPRRRRTSEEIAADIEAKEQAKRDAVAARAAKREAANRAKIEATIAKHEAVAAELRASLATA